jgi:hypothetical protein
MKFDPTKNEDDSCVYHPGGPVFHETYKSWSCCGKKTTDFTEFLNFKGCAKGKHNPEKPPEPEKPEKSAANSNEVIVCEGKKPPTSAARATDPLVKLKTVTTASLEQALSRGDPNKQSENAESGDPKEIEAGTACHNNGCTKTYQNEATNAEICYYHSGNPIFHEAMKYWSCCERKTSDFDTFLTQGGCTKGKHVWIKEKPSGQVATDCRYDFHQTGSDVYLTLYAKNAQPMDSYFEANSTNVKLHLEFNFGNSIFDLALPLWGAIDIPKSVVTLYGTKVELKLKKADPFAWPRYVFQQPAN